MEEEGEGFEEWDADFLDQVIQVEERALSTNPSQIHAPTPSSLHPPTSYLPPPPRSPRQPRRFAAAAYSSSSSFPLPNAAPVSYSPPRELSQRPPNGDARTASTLPSSPLPVSRSRSFKELEIENLKVGLLRWRIWFALLSGRTNSLSHSFLIAFWWVMFRFSFHVSRESFCMFRRRSRIVYVSRLSFSLSLLL